MCVSDCVLVVAVCFVLPSQRQGLILCYQEFIVLTLFRIKVGSVINAHKTHTTDEILGFEIRKKTCFYYISKKNLIIGMTNFLNFSS